MSILSNLSEEEKEQVKDYVNAIKETKKALQELIHKAKSRPSKKNEEHGGPRKDMIMPVNEKRKK